MTTEQSEHTDQGEADGWLYALLSYVLIYSVGTIGVGFAEPTRDLLFYPACGVVFLAVIAERVPRLPAVLTKATAVIIPVLVAVGVVAVSGLIQ